MNYQKKKERLDYLKNWRIANKERLTVYKKKYNKKYNKKNKEILSAKKKAKYTYKGRPKELGTFQIEFFKKL